MDVIEMDAASHRGIDDVRSLRENISLSPSKARKKIYIIDEAHMLTNEAFNALLKTLEEPPEHVVFILATTNPEKLPETIHSRLTKINFPKAKTSEIKRQLKRVAKAEGLKLEKGVSRLIAKAADGSFRDAVKILEQLSIDDNKITKQKVTNFLFENKDFNITEFFKLLSTKNAQAPLKFIEKMLKKGLDVENFTECLLESLHQALLAKEGLNKKDLPDFSQKEILHLLKLLSKARRQMRTSIVLQLPLEIAVVKWSKNELKNKNPDIPPPSQTKPKLEKRIKVSSDITSNIDNLWKQVLSAIKNKSTTVEALLRATRPMDFDGQKLTLGVFYQFHKERLESSQNKAVLEDILANVCGSHVQINYLLTENEKKPAATSPKDDNALSPGVEEDIISAAKEIFGN